MLNKKRKTIRKYPIIEQEVQLKGSFVKVAVVADSEPLIDQAEHEDDSPIGRKYGPPQLDLQTLLKPQMPQSLGETFWK